VALFHSVQGALRAEKALIGTGIFHKLIPVPRQISSNCGFCLRFYWNDRNKIEELLLAKGNTGIERIELESRT
jgi:hypothetical protein